MKHLFLIAIGLPLLAACNISLPNGKQAEHASSQSLADRTALDALPDGDYLFVSRKLIEAMPGNYQRIYIRKAGNTAIGAQLIYPDDNPCFKGTLQQNAIVNVQLARPFYQGQEWRYSIGEQISLEGYSRAAEIGDRKAIDQCASRF